MSSQPLILAPLETQGGRIIVTRTDFSTREATEGYAFLWRPEVPPPAWHKTLNLSEEEDPLLEAP